MSKTLKVPVDRIKDTAEKIRSYTDNDDNVNMFDRIINLVKQVESCGDWQGKSVKALIDASKRNKKKFKTVLNDLNKLADFLSQYASDMEEADSQIKAEIQKTMEV